MKDHLLFIFPVLGHVYIFPISCQSRLTKSHQFIFPEYILYQILFWLPPHCPYTSDHHVSSRLLLRLILCTHLFKTWVILTQPTISRLIWNPNAFLWFLKAPCEWHASGFHLKPHLTTLLIVLDFSATRKLHIFLHKCYSQRGVTLLMFPPAIVPVDHQESLLFYDLILHSSLYLLLCKKIFICFLAYHLSFLHILLKIGILPVFVTNLPPTVIVYGKCQCLNKACCHQAISPCSHPSCAPWWDSWQRKEDAGPR